MNNGRGETTRHARLKRLAFLWAQAHGYSACAMEVSLPRCRYRADVGAYRSLPKKFGSTAIFECKQALCDLRRDNCHSESARKVLDAVCRRRQVLENNLRVHYPNLRINDSLFPEFTSHDFSDRPPRIYARSAPAKRAAKSSLPLHEVRQIDAVPLRQFVLSRLACRAVPRFGDSGRMGRACGT